MLVFIPFIAAAVYLQCFTESVFIFNPLIDTYLPEGFTQANFNKIQPGMTKAEVLELIPGEPQGKTETKWTYGSDGAAPWGDFAWIRFSIEFDRLGKVIKTEQLTFHD
jgi:hypothetical protein